MIHEGRIWPLSRAGGFRFFRRFSTSFIVNALAEFSSFNSSHKQPFLALLVARHADKIPATFRPLAMEFKGEIALFQPRACIAFCSHVPRSQSINLPPPYSTVARTSHTPKDGLPCAPPVVCPPNRCCDLSEQPRLEARRPTPTGNRNV
jgi:hypothetical protein